MKLLLGSLFIRADHVSLHWRVKLMVISLVIGGVLQIVKALVK